MRKLIASFFSIIAVFIASPFFATPVHAANYSVNYGKTTQLELTASTDDTAGAVFLKLFSDFDLKNDVPGAGTVTFEINKGSSGCVANDTSVGIFKSEGIAPACSYTKNGNTGTITILTDFRSSFLTQPSSLTTYYIGLTQRENSKTIRRIALQKSIDIVPPPQADLSKVKASSATKGVWGATANMQVIGLPTSQISEAKKFTFKIASKTRGYIFSFTLNKDATCKIDDSIGDVYSFANKNNACSNGTLPVNVFYDTSLFIQPTGKGASANSFVDPYTITLTGPDGTVLSSLPLSLETTIVPVTVSINPNPVAEKQDFVVTVKGCPANSEIKVNYESSYNPGAGTLHGSTNMGTATSVTVHGGFGGTGENRIKGDWRNLGAFVTATCTANKKVSNTIEVMISQNGSGHETITLKNAPLISNTKPLFVVNNLPFDVATEKKCYYLVMTSDEDVAIPEETTHADGCDRMDDNSHAVISFLPDEGSPTKTIDNFPVTLPDGWYAVALMRAEKDPSWLENHSETVLSGVLGGAGALIGSGIAPVAGTAGGAVVGIALGKKLGGLLNGNEDSNPFTARFCVGGACEGLLYGSNTTPCLYGLDKKNQIVDVATEDDDTKRKTMQDSIVQCTGVYTPFGRLSTDPVGFIQSIFSLILSISGGIALLMLLYSGYQLMTSQGNPEKVKAARDRVTSAIVGIIFMVLSLVILQTIGVDILNIPGFGK